MKIGSIRKRNNKPLFRFLNAIARHLLADGGKGRVRVNSSLFLSGTALKSSAPA